MTSASFILALDQGTTSSRTLIFDKSGEVVGAGQQEFAQIYPQPGWVEHNAEDIWRSQCDTVAQAIEHAGISVRQIKGIGITNQRETTVLWDRQTGAPVGNAIVWQDRRTSEVCDALKEAGHFEVIRSKTGLVLDAYFSATKLQWMLDRDPEVRRRAERGELAFGTVDSWLVWKMTEGTVHVTDVSNASRTMLFNIHTLEWDEDLLALFNIPPAVLPRVVSSSETVGHTTLFSEDAIPISGIAGDQQAALFGQQCTEPGMVKNTYGTGCFMLMNTGETPKTSDHALLTTVAWKIGKTTTYALEGSVFIGGAVVQWLRDELKIIEDSSQVEALAAQVEDTNGVYFVPAFAGLGAPHWEQHARGSVFGLTRGSSDAHLARAALDSIAYQVADVLDAMSADSGIAITELRVDGGASMNAGLMGFQADLLHVEVVRPVVSETTALGAAYLAGLAVGYWQNEAEIQAQWQRDSIFAPRLDSETTARLRNGWKRALRAALHWANERPSLA